MNYDADSVAEIVRILMVTEMARATMTDLFQMYLYMELLQ
jgi:hypothetical protein